MTAFAKTLRCYVTDVHFAATGTLWNGQVPSQAKTCEFSVMQQGTGADTGFHSGLPHVREKFVFFKVREMSGNFETCQGKIEFWKMSWKTDLCQGKFEFPGVHAKHLPILGHQLSVFSFFPIKINMLL